MARRIPDRYTILIAQTDKEPLIFTLRPVTLVAMLGAIACLMLVPFYLCWQKDGAVRQEAVQSQSEIHTHAAR